MKRLMNGFNKQRVFTIFLPGILFALTFSTLFTPIAHIGDGPAYLKYAMQVAGHDVPENFIHRSPLYSHLIATVINRVEKDVLYRILVSIQFVLNFFTSYLIFCIGEFLYSRKALGVLAATLFFFNPASIYFAYVILTESLAIFLFIVVVYSLLKFQSSLHLRWAVCLGTSTTLLFLSRFNTLPIMLVLLVIFLYITRDLIRDRLMKFIKVLCAFICPVIILLNMYCLYNWYRYQEFRVLSLGGSSMISRNAIIASLDGDEKVTPDLEPVLKVFLQSKKDYYEQLEYTREGSLLEYDKFRLMHKLGAGFGVYKLALEDVKEYYGLDEYASESEIAKAISPFYQQILNQNRTDILKLRLYSFLNGFRSSLGPIEKTHFVVARGDKVNLDLLPAGIRVFFKLIYLGVSLSTLVLCLIHVTSNLLKGRGGKTAFYIIVILCYSFYATNFMFATMMDANRFNYPSEPLMLLLFIYNINILFRREDLSMARNNRWDLFCS